MTTINQAFICDAIRTPFGRYGGAFKDIRADDLGAIPLRALMERNPKVDWANVQDVLYGCANQFRVSPSTVYVVRAWMQWEVQRARCVVVTRR